MSSLQMCIWSRRKKLATTLKTEIKAINDEKLAKNEVSQTKRSAETIVFKEITAITKCDKFQRCLKCTEKIPQTTCSRIEKCHKCRTMKLEKCQVDLFLTVTVETMEKEQFLHLHDEILPSILKHDVSSMDRSPIAEELLEKAQLLHLHGEILPSILNMCHQLTEAPLRKNFCLLKTLPCHTMLTVLLCLTWNTHQQHHQQNEH